MTMFEKPLWYVLTLGTSSGPMPLAEAHALAATTPGAFVSGTKTFPAADGVTMGAK